MELHAGLKKNRKQSNKHAQAGELKVTAAVYTLSSPMSSVSVGAAKELSKGFARDRNCRVTEVARY